jgi:hypothetical protein
LAAARQIRMHEHRWVIAQTQTVDTQANPERGRKLKAEWMKVALSRLEGGVNGTFAYNLMAISRADLARLKELHFAYFATCRRSWPTRLPANASCCSTRSSSHWT